MKGATTMNFRVKHDKDTPYFQVARATAQDAKLNFDALGLLTYLLSKPDDWECNIRDLMKRGEIGRDKTYRIVNTLIKAGYMRRRQERDQSGAVSKWHIDVHELPLPENQDIGLLPENTEVALLPEKPDTDFPEVGRARKDSKCKRLQAKKAPLHNTDINIREKRKNIHDITQNHESFETSSHDSSGDDAQLTVATASNEQADGHSQVIIVEAQSSPLRGHPPETPRPPSKSRKPTGDLRSQHPAIQAFRAATGRFPNKLLYDDLIAKLGDEPDTAFLTQCARSWLNYGYNLMNLSVWLDEWYVNRQIKPLNGNGRDRHNGTNGNGKTKYTYADLLADRRARGIR